MLVWGNLCPSTSLRIAFRSSPRLPLTSQTPRLAGSFRASPGGREMLKTAPTGRGMDNHRRSACDRSNGLHVIQHVCGRRFTPVCDRETGLKSSAPWTFLSTQKGKLALVKCFLTDRVRSVGLNHKECQGVQRIVAAVLATK